MSSVKRSYYQFFRFIHDEWFKRLPENENEKKN